MCVETMATEGRKQREGRAHWWRRRRSAYTGLMKAAFRKYVGKSPRRPGRRFHGLPWEKKPQHQQEQAHALPSGAMAPRNTTQYLMELVYSDLRVPQTNCREHTSSHTSLFTDQDTLDFQQRDFERVFFQNEI